MMNERQMERSPRVRTEIERSMSLALNKPKLDNLADEIWKSAERLRGKFKAYEYQNVVLPDHRDPPPGVRADQVARGQGGRGAGQAAQAAPRRNSRSW